MDDYLHFAEAHSLYLFRGKVLDPEVRQAWELLRVVVLHYFRAIIEEHDTFPFTEEACQCAEKAMLDFAKLMEEVMHEALISGAACRCERLCQNLPGWCIQGSRDKPEVPAAAHFLSWSDHWHKDHTCVLLGLHRSLCIVM